MADEVVAAFKGELQFAGWTDSSRGGPRVTFRLADRDLLERFIGCEGKRYACMLVELGDDETPAEPAAPAAAKTAAPAKRERMGPLCEWAVMRCGEPTFQAWAALPRPKRWRIDDIDQSPQGRAKAVILCLCDVQSRKELDTNPVAAQRLHDLVRRPYMQWLEHQQVPA
jgi:hypothetical protein